MIGCGGDLFTHTSVRTSNMEKSIDFYTRLLGLKLLNRHEIAQNNAEVAFLQDPEGKGGEAGADPLQGPEKVRAGGVRGQGLRPPRLRNQGHAEDHRSDEEGGSRNHRRTLQARPARLADSLRRGPGWNTNRADRKKISRRQMHEKSRLHDQSLNNLLGSTQR